MRFYAHLALGFAVLGFIISSWSLKLVLLVILGSVIPDIDYPYSLIGKLWPEASNFLFKHFGGHRGLLHSIYIPVTLILDFFYWNNFSYLVFSIAYTSHIVLDLMTYSGTRLFYPLKYYFTILDGDMDSTSKKDNITVTIICTVIFIVWLFWGNFLVSLVS